MEIRQARPHEHEEIGRLTQAAYHEYERSGDPLWQAYFESLGDVASRARCALVLVAVEAGRILGTATVELDSAIDGEQLMAGQANLRMLAVAPEVRSQGVGGRLVAACIAEARAAGKHVVTLHTTEEMAAAMRLYRSFGFERDLARDVAIGETVRLIAYRLPLLSSPG